MSNPTLAWPSPTRRVAFSQFVEPAPDNRIEQRRHPRDKIGHRNEGNLLRVVAKSLLEHLGDVGHPIEIAGANKTLPRSFWRCHRQDMQARDVAHIATLKPKRGRAGIEPSNSFLTNSIEAE